MPLVKHWRKALLFVLIILLALPLFTRLRGGGEYAQLPLGGANFEAYSLGLYALGRCYLKAPLSEGLVDAYARLLLVCPEQQFVYAEMGWKGGGSFYPHRTHREGLSADFITPMRERNGGAPAKLPLSPFNRWGYDLRLDSNGCYNDVCMDAEAVALHLAALETSARTRGYRIRQVIFDPAMFTLLKKHPNYREISHLPFMQGKAWFPHDSHYHVDFQSLR